jgi:predicted  nucleic acid-binding Zn-ribbon protein
MVKRAKGKRPIYLGDPQIDKLLAIVMALAGEVSVLRERLDTVERLAQAKAMFTINDIETYQPDEQVAQEREQWRSDYIARLLRVIEEEVDALK